MRFFPNAVVLVVFCGLIAHALLLATDYVIWDGWWQFADIAWAEGPIVTQTHLAEVGRPLDNVYYFPFQFVETFASRAWLSKALGALLWIATALLMTLVLKRAARVPSDAATAIGALVASSSVFAMLGEYSLWMYTSAVFLFWLGWAGLTVLPSWRGAPAFGLRCLLLATFFLSFSLNSLLVAYYSVALALFALRLRSWNWPDVFGSATRSIRSFPDFLILPVVFWSWKKVFHPSTGAYADYNTPLLSVGHLAAGFLEMYRQMIAPLAFEMLSSPIWIVGAVFAALAVLWMGCGKDPARRASDNLGPKLMTVGVLLFVASIFPYLAVGQIPSLFGWTSRNAILTPLPLAMSVVGIAMTATRVTAFAPPRAWYALVVALVVLNVGACWRNYLTLQAFGLKQEAVAFQINNVTRQMSTALIQLRDYFRIPRTVDFYAPSIWTFLPTGGELKPQTFVFETTSMAPDQVQFDESGKPVSVSPWIPVNRAAFEDLIKSTTLDYAMTGIPRVGRHVLLKVYPTEADADPLRLGAEYIRRKWFARDTLEDFVKAASSSQVAELTPVLDQ
jgi:hypothetical protein